MTKPYVTFFGAACAMALWLGSGQIHPKHANKADVKHGEEMFLRYCASCHGKDGKGGGPAATAMNTPPPDLTTLARRNNGKYPVGYVGALIKFGRSLAAHGSDEMPVWGTRFGALDPVHDPTGQQHVDDLVSYVQSMQVK